ncbi:4687_t:CDS:10 [Ambispora gerdemannii]|uniref:4687_t:CDS:1 n=1 Tax=Ambispora gerdemannii TaxID=144530 RepID=A0A9N8V991_9GLOM|nr:4687_t:CDS:10 [Ambispora gerdemannii]
MEPVNGPTHSPSLNSPTSPDMSPEAVNMTYTHAFLHLRPKEAFDAIQARLRKAKLLNDELALYFSERAAIEDAYVKSLQRLSSKKNFMSDKSILGAFSNVWEPLFQEVTEISNVHSLFVEKISEEVEAPIRGNATSEDWLQLKNYETTLGKIVKDHEERLLKVNKLKSKNEKLTGKKHEASEMKLKEAQKVLDNSQHEWLREAPHILEKYQSVDEARLTNLKESIARFETIQVETCQKRVLMAERTLETVFTFDVLSEIENFCLQKIEGNNLNDFSNISVTSATSNSSKLKTAIGTMRRKKTATSNHSSEMPSHTKLEENDLVGEELNITPYNLNNSHNQQDSSTSVDSPIVSVLTYWPKVIVDIDGPPPDRSYEDFSGDEDSDTKSEAMRIRVEIKNETIPENNDEEAETAIKHVTNTLRSQQSTLSLGRNRRGRRESHYRKTILDSDNGSNGVFSDLPIEIRPAVTPEMSSSTSSPTSLTSSEANYRVPLPSTSKNSQGLRATISEVLNVIIKGGEVAKISVTGEISLISNRTTVQPVKLKITNFSILDKAAPNSSYINPSTSGEAGEYEVNMEMLSFAGGAPVVIMKYQVHIDPEHKDEYVPIQIVPQWKCEPNKTAFAVNYQPNPNFKLTGTLSDLSFLIPVDGEVVGKPASKPTCNWNVEKQIIVWQIGDLDLSSSEKKHLLTRFDTKNNSKPSLTAVKFTCKGQLLSSISLEASSPPPLSSSSSENVNGFSQQKDELIEFEEVICQVVSGKYLASQ